MANEEQQVGFKARHLATNSHSDAKLNPSFEASKTHDQLFVTPARSQKIPSPYRAAAILLLRTPLSEKCKLKTALRWANILSHP